MEPSVEQIQELRNKFLEKLENAASADKFHSLDMARVNNDDHWLRRFLIHHDCNMKDSLKMLWETCEWRKSYGTNEISENNIRMDYIESGSLFPHGRDRDGKAMLIFKCKEHVKGQRNFDELKRCLVYWFERLDRSERGDVITVFFDLADSGLSNIDMEYTRYLIDLGKYYYPHFLNYILVFEMPWVLTAAFKIIKSWLPAKAVQKIKFLNKSNLKDYVDPDQSLIAWGGTDPYVFEFVPENTMTYEGLEENKKKVHFADGSPMVEMSPSFVALDGDGSKSDHPNLNTSLEISPFEVINFAHDGNEISSSVTLTNRSENNLSYKIKTTSPEKFRVRPGSGVLAPGTTAIISVFLQPGYEITSTGRDKFLIMHLPINSLDIKVHELAELWKQLGTKDAERHKLSCTFSGHIPETAMRNGSAFGNVNSFGNDQKISRLITTVAQLGDRQLQIQRDLRFSQNLQKFLICCTFFFGFMIIYMLKYPPLPDSSRSNLYCPRSHQEL